MLLRHSNLFSSLIFIWDSVSLRVSRTVVRLHRHAMFIGGLAPLFWILPATGVSRMPSRGEA